jgi:23S rRNA pseudouridine2605 synthase
MKDFSKNTKSVQPRQSAKRQAQSDAFSKSGTQVSDKPGNKPVGKAGRKNFGITTSGPFKKNPKKHTGKSVVRSVNISASNPAGKPERIAKRMARAGLCSRREAEAWILAGRVSVNGRKLDSPAMTITLEDRIEVDGNPLSEPERTRLWLYHKPAGVLSTNRDPEGRPTLFEKLPKDLPRMMSVGRLDMNTEGLLLMTNDGGLARILELPSTGWLRRYRVRAHGKVDQAKLESLKDGIAVDGVLYGPIEAAIDREQGANVWLTVAIREGKNREVKNVLGAIGLEVNRLIRISYGPFQLGDLGAGEIQEIRGRMLRDQLGERLVKEAGADFDAPIHNQKRSDQPDPGRNKSAKNTDDAKKKSKKKSRKKSARGAIETGTMEQLETKKFTGSYPPKGRHNARKTHLASRVRKNRKSK